MILKLNESFGDEMVDKVVAFCNSLDNSYGTIYLNSRGGKYNCMEVIQDILSRNRRITLIGYGQLLSCAFELFFSVSCETILLDGTVGMFHQSSVDIEMNEYFKPNYKEDEAKKLYMTAFQRNKTHGLCKKLNLSTKEMRSINRGDDVWFDTKRMLEFQQIVSNTKSESILIV